MNKIRMTVTNSPPAVSDWTYFNGGDIFDKFKFSLSIVMKIEISRNDRHCRYYYRMNNRFGDKL